MPSIANPTVFMGLVQRVLPWLWLAVAALVGVGLWLAFFEAPADYQQGETVRIMFIHVPAAWLSMFIYMTMVAAALGSLVWRHPLAEAALKAAAPLGAGFTFICLATGSLWGKPMWGTWWVWDARLTSVLVLFILYLGLIALWQTIEEPGRAARAAAILTLVGAIRADHQILGRLVELAAPARLGVQAGRADDPSLHAVAVADHGGRLHPAVHGLAPDGGPHRNPAPPRSAPDLAGRRDGERLSADGRGGVEMSAADRIGFIAAAYGLTACVVAAMIAYLIVDYRGRMRDLARLRARSGKDARGDD